VKFRQNVPPEKRTSPPQWCHHLALIPGCRGAITFHLASPPKTPARACPKCLLTHNQQFAFEQRLVGLFSFILYASVLAVSARPESVGKNMIDSTTNKVKQIESDIADVLVELYQLLNMYEPLWYERQHQRKAEAVLRKLGRL